MNLFDNYTDEDLVNQLKLDNSQAFEALYNRYWKRMLIKAYTLLGSEADAEEVVQNVFVNIWNRRHRFDLQFTFHTYLTSAVKYEILALTAKSRKVELADADDVRFTHTPDNSTQHWLDVQDLTLQIEATVQTLPEKCQLIFRLSREQHLSEKQIAETLLISPKTVQAHLTKALKTLRVSLRYFCFSMFLFLS